ncbi:MAG: YgjP-like metallopeptidase domain-containing protein [Acidiferrobacter thiooxydans]|jgi:hypothetical protein|nr:DUF45 domain-containing protein [Gammaproteobacteria bacterium]
MTTLKTSEAASMQFPMVKHAGEIGWEPLTPFEALTLRADESSSLFRGVLERKILEFNPRVSKDAARSIVETFLVGKDERFQDYVIVHELLHLRFSTHGRMFKALMSACKEAASIAVTLPKLSTTRHHVCSWTIRFPKTYRSSKPTGSATAASRWTKNI